MVQSVYTHHIPGTHRAVLAWWVASRSKVSAVRFYGGLDVDSAAFVGAAFPPRETYILRTLYPSSPHLPPIPTPNPALFDQNGNAAGGIQVYRTDWCCEQARLFDEKKHLTNGDTQLDERVVGTKSSRVGVGPGHTRVRADAQPQRCSPLSMHFGNQGCIFLACSTVVIVLYSLQVTHFENIFQLVSHRH